MRTVLGRGATALVALGALALVGCASSAVSMDRPAGTILQAANTQALNSSFQVAFTGRLQVDLSGVSATAGLTSAELALIQDEINTAQLTGVAEIQSSKAMELSFTLSPLLTQTWHELYLNGSEYLSENGTQWYSVTDAASSGAQKSAAGAASSALGNLKAEIKSLGLELNSSATVTKLGTTAIGGSQVEHLETTISGPNLDHALASMLGDVASDLGTEGATLNSELPAIEGLLQFTQVKTDSYVLTSTGQLARTDETVGLNLNLSELATLVPGETGLPTGKVPMRLSLSGNFSDYGKDFGLQKPSHIVAGPPPTPSGLAGVLGQT